MLFAPEIKATLFIVVSLVGSIQSVALSTEKIEFSNVRKCQEYAESMSMVKYKANEALAQGLGVVKITAVCIEQ